MDVIPLKKNLQVEELRTGAAVSEGTAQRMASSTNFWNSYYEGSRGWFLNGRYDIIAAPQIGVDGPIFCPSNMEIFAIGMTNFVAGTSGNTEFDIIRHYADGSPSATIFTTRPVIPFDSGDFAWFVRHVRDATTLFASAGVTLPVLVSANLDAGDMLTCNFTDKQVAGESASIVLFLTPR